jgi:hypothetical protein
MKRLASRTNLNITPPYWQDHEKEEASLQKYMVNQFKPQRQKCNVEPAQTN